MEKSEILERLNKALSDAEQQLNIKGLHDRYPCALGTLEGHIKMLQIELQAWLNQESEVV